MCNDTDKYVKIREKKRGTLSLASKVTVEITATGNVGLVAESNRRSNHVTIRNTLHVPELRTNLLPVAKITDKGYKVIFDSVSANIIGNKGRVAMTYGRKDGLHFQREYEHDVQAHMAEMGMNESRLSSTEMWHSRLGQPKLQKLGSM
ncbi:hypothetical protein KM043_013406 [Ampulex compressa]|nr:hypothetical protein KM043_013406 [Ampulex compressa]